MPISLKATVEHFPIAGAFTISRGSKTTASVVTCRITEGTVSGWAECVPYARYGESVESVLSAIESVRPLIEEGMAREDLQEAMKPGAARNAVDCALWDIEAKRRGRTAASLAGIADPMPLTTAFTLSLAEPEAMGAQAAKHAKRALLKVKVGTADDTARIRAVRKSAPDSRIILDANEGWTADNIAAHFSACAENGIALIEQPLPAGQDDILAGLPRPVPVCADESVHATQDIKSLADRYDAVNIKLDKTGGLTEALRMRAAAEALGLKIMIGCMVGSSLAMAPVVLLAQGADFVDLDGPLLLSKDRSPGLRYEASLVFPAEASLWG
ncbi:dipeptide epimerase [Sinorhizobium medicae]|nr:dipeptide epimerase [Sinorhizobium medicae]MDX0780457.1 dipeptide epimerase [Sinorhizobium medicae]